MTDQLAQTAELQGITRDELIWRLLNWTPEQWNAAAQQHESTAARPAQTDGDLPFSTAVTHLVGLGAGIGFDAAHAIVSRAAQIGYCLTVGDEILVTASAGRDRFAITTN